MQARHNVANTAAELGLKRARGRRKGRRGCRAREICVSRRVHRHSCDRRVCGDSVGKRRLICSYHAGCEKQQKRRCPHGIKYTAQLPTILALCRLRAVTPVASLGYLDENALHVEVQRRSPIEPNAHARPGPLRRTLSPTPRATAFTPYALTKQPVARELSREPPPPGRFPAPTLDFPLRGRRWP